MPYMYIFSQKVHVDKVAYPIFDQCECFILKHLCNKTNLGVESLQNVSEVYHMPTTVLLRTFSKICFVFNSC